MKNYNFGRFTLGTTSCLVVLVSLLFPILLAQTAEAGNNLDLPRTVGTIYSKTTFHA